MSLIKGARELATNVYTMGCTVEHVFLAALPPLGNQNLDEPARQVLNIFSGEILKQWKLQVRVKLSDFKDPPPVGQDSQDLKEVLLQAEHYAAQNKRDRDDDQSLLLALVMRTKRIQDYIEEAQSGDLQRLLDKLNEGKAAPAFLDTADVVKQKVEEEAKVARESLADLLRDFPPTEDRHYADFPAVDVNAFLDFLANAASQAQVVVAVGRHGSVIDEIPKVIADKLAKKDGSKGLPDSLADYSGKLCVLDMHTVVARAKIPGGPKLARVLRAACEHVLALPEKSILMLDHIEAIESDAKEPEIEDLRSAIAAPGRQLIFGIFHAPIHGDHTSEASLGREDAIMSLPMKVYDKALTNTLLEQFYVPSWRNKPPHGYEFTEDAFDILMDLVEGAWVHRSRIVLPGLVTAVAGAAMQTAANGPERIKATVQCALNAFTELAKEQASSPEEHARFERIVKQAEKEVSTLAPKPRAKGPFSWLRRRPHPQVPSASIMKLTAAHVLAEFICVNVSEFHYPGNMPTGITHES